MLELIVMRHATAANRAPSDHERPLDPYGWREAAAMAATLDAARWRPCTIESSDALRTQETYASMATVWGPDAPAVRCRQDLYLGSVAAMLAVIAGFGSSVSRPMILAHNPGCEELVTWLTGVRVRMSTANAALLKHTGSRDWAGASKGESEWTLEELARPLP